MNNILGYTTGTYNTSIITTTKFYYLNIDNYINLYITNLNTGLAPNANGRLLIPLNAVNRQIVYIGELNLFTKTISITDPYFVRKVNLKHSIVEVARWCTNMQGSRGHPRNLHGINKYSR